jgi:hypothetical protein
MRYATALLLCVSAAYAGPAEDAYTLMVMHLAVQPSESKPCATCGKVNCDCGCKDGNNCVCAVPSAAYYNVNGTVVKASTWAEAYKVAGTSQAAPAASYVPATYSPAYVPNYAQTAPQMPFQGSYGGYSAPSYQGGSYGAACAGGG